MTSQKLYLKESNKRLSLGFHFHSSSSNGGKFTTGTKSIQKGPYFLIVNVSESLRIIAAVKGNQRLRNLGSVCSVHRFWAHHKEVTLCSFNKKENKSAKNNNWVKKERHD